MYTQLCAPRMSDALAPFDRSHPSPSHYPGVLWKVNGVDSGGADAVSKGSAGPPRTARVVDSLQCHPRSPHPRRSEQRPASQDPSCPAPAGVNQPLWVVRPESSLPRPSGPSSAASSSFPATRGVSGKGGTWCMEGLPECSPPTLPRPEPVRASRSEGQWPEGLTP